MIPSTHLDSRSYGVSLDEPRPKKRARRTRAELEGLDQALAVIVEEIEPATVRQVFLSGCGPGDGPER